MKIGFIKDEEVKKEVKHEEKLKVIWVLEKDKEKEKVIIPLLEEVPLEEKKKVVYKNTFNMHIFAKLVNYYDVKIENALKLSNDKEFCDNFIANMTRGVGRLSQSDLIRREKELNSVIYTLGHEILKTIINIENSMPIITKKFINDILRGKEIIREESIDLNSEYCEIEKKVKKIDYCIKELDELNLKFYYKGEIKKLKKRIEEFFK